MAFGQAASARPLSDEFGFSRGMPIDRHYIEAFLADHAADIHGRVLEIGDDAYSQRFGGSRITKQDILHVDADHPRATIVGDLTQAGVLPEGVFDCIVFTQTLHLIFDMATALANLRTALRPGGVLLISVPGITRIDGGEWKDSWYWSLTEQALSRLLSGPFRADRVSTRTYGNLFSATAFLHGAAVEEVSRAKLDTCDRSFPVIVAARAVG